MRTLLNLIWLLFSGLWLAIGYALAGLLLCLLIVTIPFGLACFRLSAFVLWPFGRAVVRKPEAGAPSTLANVLWFVLAGLWMALSHLLLGVVLCLTIIGIPLGLGNFKLAAVAIAPLGKEIVPASDPRPRPEPSSSELAGAAGTVVPSGSVCSGGRAHLERQQVPGQDHGAVEVRPGQCQPFGLGAGLRCRHRVRQDQGTDAVAGCGPRRVLH